MMSLSSQVVGARTADGGSSFSRPSRVPSSRLFAAAVIAVLAIACTPDLPTTPHGSQAPAPAWTSPAVGTLPPVEPGDSATADRLARGMALALAQPAMRHLVLTDLRDSPFPRHALDLASYLHGAHARALTAAIARELEVRPENVVQMATVRGGLELVLPIAKDRSMWTGSDNIVVVGAAYTVAEDIRAQHQPFAHTVIGQTVPAHLFRPMPVPLLAVEPAMYAFGPDPEGTRLKAPQHFRATVSTFAEGARENYLLTAGSVRRFSETTPCNNQTAILPDTPCSAEPGQGPLGVYLASGSTFNDCVPNGGNTMSDASQDQDKDGVRDSCEYELAQAFHPQMQFMQNDCLTSREPYWAVNYQISPIDGTPVVAIFYAIGYHYDCGESGCPISACDPHYGDSEFIVEEVSTDGYPTDNGPHWLLRYATLSAHYNTRVESTGTYGGSDLEYGNAPLASNPLVWVSQGKHGNYRSQSVCDAGASGADNCDHPGERVGLEILPGANLGSSSYRINDVVQSRVGGVYSGTEYMWAMDNTGPTGFLGWLPRSYGNGETPYGLLLANFGFF